MAQILVMAESPDETADTVVYREWISTSDFESDHFSGQLAERVAWAVKDAKAIEQKGSRAVRLAPEHEIPAVA